MKEYLYVGYYVDVDGNFILKIGTTNDLQRRRTEHNRNYKRSVKYTLPPSGSFEYLWTLALSKYNTLRYEDYNRQAWRDLGIGEFIKNDRFKLSTPLDYIPVKIRKTYEIALSV